MRKGYSVPRDFTWIENHKLIKWNKLEKSLQISESASAFKNQILTFIRKTHISTFNVHNPNAIKLLLRLRVELSHLREHKLICLFIYLLTLF